MSPRARWMVVLLAIAAVFGGYAAYRLGVGDAAPDYDDPRLIARGRTVFAERCARCHGERAAGADPDRPGGGRTAAGEYIAPALDGSAHAWHHAPDQLFRLVARGSPAPGSPMTGQGDVLSDRDIHAVLAYLQSLWPEPLRARYRRAFDR